jgi:hypothetical protein
MSMRKSFAFACSLAACALVGVACSSNGNNADGGDGGIPDDSGHKDSGIKPVGDSGANSCDGAAPASYVAMKPPQLQIGACSQNTIVQLAGVQSDSQLQAVLDTAEPACKTCLNPSAETAAQWGPFINRDQNNPDGDNWNEGGCAVAAGAPQACGAAIQKYTDCITLACLQCDATGFGQCAQDVQATGGACESVLNDTQSACTQGQLQAWAAACLNNGAYSLWKLVNTLCGPGNTDGGNDSGSNDASDSGG